MDGYFLHSPQTRNYYNISKGRRQGASCKGDREERERGEMLLPSALVPKYTPKKEPLDVIELPGLAIYRPSRQIALTRYSAQLTPQAQATTRTPLSLSPSPTSPLDMT